MPDFEKTMERLFYFVIILFMAFSCQGKATAPDGDGNALICHPSDREIVEQVLQKFAPLAKSETGFLVREIALHFVGTPYVAHTLENGPEEKLVVNLREMDCTTFAENCLALARTLQMKKPGFEVFTEQLEKIRYRGGSVTDTFHVCTISATGFMTTMPGKWWRVSRRSSPTWWFPTRSIS